MIGRDISLIGCVAGNSPASRIGRRIGPQARFVTIEARPRRHHIVVQVSGPRIQALSREDSSFGNLAAVADVVSFICNEHADVEVARTLHRQNGSLIRVGPDIRATCSDFILAILAGINRSSRTWIVQVSEREAERIDVATSR